MYTATTPTFTWRFADTLDMTQATDMVATIKSEKSGFKLNKVMEDLDITEHAVSVFLTQEETLKFPAGDATIMLNWIYDEGNKIKRACTKETTIKVNKNLYNEVME